MSSTTLTDSMIQALRHTQGTPVPRTAKPYLGGCVESINDAGLRED